MKSLLFLHLDIHTSPPTRMAIAKARRNMLIVRVIALLGLGIVSSWLFLQERDISMWMPVLVILTSSVGVWGLTPSYPDMWDSGCSVLLEACMATPEGKLYRQRVIAEGRPFLESEYMLLANWSDKAKAPTESLKPTSFWSA